MQTNEQGCRHELDQVRSNFFKVSAIVERSVVLAIVLGTQTHYNELHKSYMSWLIVSILITALCKNEDCADFQLFISNLQL